MSQDTPVQNESAAGQQQTLGLRPTRPAARREITRDSFMALTSISKKLKSKQEGSAVGVESLYLGIAVVEVSPGNLDVGFAAHDGTYSVDYAIKAFQNQGGSSDSLATELSDYLIDRLANYRTEHLHKFLGAGLTTKIVELSPQLPSRLWAELDIVPFVFGTGSESLGPVRHRYSTKTVDEEADSMARKCLTQYGPTTQPRLTVGYRNEVEVDCGGLAQMTQNVDYQNSVGKSTWDATIKYAESLKKNNTRIAFFNTTPQGGGVALMRHALIRYLRQIGVDARWYVPKPKPEVFRITKNNHNILQGVADPNLRLTQEQINTLNEWCEHNAQQYWTVGDGPLAPIAQGGAHVIIVDDPQMPSLVKISKLIDPDRPVIFRSHIQVRADLADQPGTPTSEVWNWVWDNVKHADVFISHPVRDFVPNNVHSPRVGYMPATTDWLDGLNKDLDDWDSEFYMHEFEAECFKIRMNRLAFPSRRYIAQIARFDPAKGIPDVLASYAELRRKYMKDMAIEDTPQLVIAGHGAIDDPDATHIYDETINLLNTKYADIKEDVIVMRVKPIDQLLNALISCAHVVLQLSTREGFEVKVSEAVHKGIPVIATNAGGIPLQVQDRKSGFLVKSGDSHAVAKHLHYLFTNKDAYDEMSSYAHAHVSDEVSTVGNALCWLYLADMLARGKTVEPNWAWVNDLAREEAGLPYKEGETRLPRVDDLHARPLPSENMSVEAGSR